MAARVDRDGRRLQIALKATELFARRGYGAVSLGELAAEAGLSRTVIYRHFRSKREIFDAGIRANLDILRAARRAVLDGNAPTPQKLLAVLTQTADFLCAHRPFLVALYDFVLARGREGEDMGARVVDFTGHLREGLAELVRAGVAEGAFATDIRPDEAADVFLTQFESCTMRLVLGLESDARAARARLAALVADMSRSAPVAEDAPSAPPRTLVCNGWAAGPETWSLCAFPRDWVFSYVEQLDGLAERVLAEGAPAVLVGFSMGGCHALQLLARHPDKVAGLVLVSATPRMTEDSATHWRGMSARRVQALRLGTQLVYRHDPSPLYATANLERGLDFLCTTDVRDELKAAAARNPGVFARLPVRILQSERDGIVRPDNALWLGEVFPQAEVTWVPGTEHVLPVVACDRVDSAVRDVQVRAHP